MTKTFLIHPVLHIWRSRGKQVHKFCDIIIIYYIIVLKAILFSWYSSLYYDRFL